MVPAITEGGRSFKGAALYYLHDKRQAGEAERLTSGRVAWTQTVNLATDDVGRAWRIMAHTAMSQAELKQAAGVKATGRKLTKPVHAYSLAWHPDQRVDKDLMLSTALDSLKAQGLEGYQAIIIAHDDEPQQHVHVVVNRVHPETGVAATLSNCKLNLSKWAEAYEQKQGKVYCKKRVENNEKRKKGEHIREPRIPRPVFEFNQSTGNDNLTADFVQTDQKQKDAQLYAFGRTMQESHSRQWAGIKQTYVAGKEKITDHGKRLKSIKADELKDYSRQQWQTLFLMQRIERDQFKVQETSFLSGLFNGLSLLNEIRQNTDGNRLMMVFALLSRSGREDALLTRQEAQRRELAKEIRDYTKAAYRQIDKGISADLARLRTAYIGQCGDLKAVQDKQKGEMQTAWTKRNAERAAALAPYGRDSAARWSRAANIGTKSRERGHGIGRGRRLQPKPGNAPKPD